MKKRRIGKYIIVGTFMILTGVVGVSAANTLTSNGVLYRNAGSSVTTVEGALNELYANYNSLLAKGNASASDILSGKTALVKGKEVTGTMPSYADKGYYHVEKGKIGIASGNIYLRFPVGAYLTANATGYVETWTEASNLGITADKIVAGQTIAGVTGTYTSDANATAAQILSGKTAYVNGSKITGTMVDRGTAQNTGGLGCFPGGCGTGDSQYYALNNIPEGYYHKDGYTWAPEIRVNANQMREALGITANKIAQGQTIAGIDGTYTGSNIIPNLEASLKVINAVGWAANTSKLAAVVKINVGSSISYNMSGASTRVVNNSDSNHLGTNLNSTYGYIDGANYIVQTNSGTTNTIKGLKRGAAILEIDYGSTCGKHLIIVW